MELREVIFRQKQKEKAAWDNRAKMECPHCKAKFQMDRKTQFIFWDMMAEEVAVKCPVCKKSKTYRRFQNG